MQAGNAYLIANNIGYKQIRKLKCISVTETCYEVLWQNSFNGTTDWFLIDDFNGDYQIIEDLGNVQSQSFIK